jgi:hypothetical protein
MEYTRNSSIFVIIRLLSPGLTVNKKAKLELLEKIHNGEDRFFIDYSDILIEMVSDPDDKIRQKAVECLWDYPSPKFLDILIDKAEHDLIASVATTAITMLGRYIFEGSIDEFTLEFEGGIPADEITEKDFLRTRDFLMQLHQNPEKSLDERRYALESLSFLDDPDIQDLIEAAYHSQAKLMKISAIFSMGRNGLIRWSDIILKELKNPDQDIQLASIRAAGECYLEEAGKELLRLTYSDDKDIFYEAVWSLGQTGWEGAFERLEELCSYSRNAEIQDLAEKALEEWFILHEGLDEGYEPGE